MQHLEGEFEAGTLVYHAGGRSSTPGRILSIPTFYANVVKKFKEEQVSGYLQGKNFTQNVPDQGKGELNCGLLHYIG